MNAYIDNTRADTRQFHSVIMEAIKNGGVFDADYADIFVLRATPEGSAFPYVLDFVED